MIQGIEKVAHVLLELAGNIYFDKLSNKVKLAKPIMV
jgi:hypothetical protein